VNRENCFKLLERHHFINVAKCFIDSRIFSNLKIFKVFSNKLQITNLITCDLHKQRPLHFYQLKLN
jgi:hypothetical protein